MSLPAISEKSQLSACNCRKVFIEFYKKKNGRHPTEEGAHDPFKCILWTYPLSLEKAKDSLCYGKSKEVVDLQSGNLALKVSDLVQEARNDLKKIKFNINVSYHNREIRAAVLKHFENINRIKDVYEKILDEPSKIASEQESDESVQFAEFFDNTLSYRLSAIKKEQAQAAFNLMNKIAVGSPEKDINEARKLIKQKSRERKKNERSRCVSESSCLNEEELNMFHQIEQIASSGDEILHIAEEAKKLVSRIAMSLLVDSATPVRREGKES